MLRYRVCRGDGGGVEGVQAGQLEYSDAGWALEGTRLVLQGSLLPPSKPLLEAESQPEWARSRGSSAPPRAPSCTTQSPNAAPVLMRASYGHASPSEGQREWYTIIAGRSTPKCRHVQSAALLQVPVPRPLRPSRFRRPCLAQRAPRSSRECSASGCRGPARLSYRPDCRRRVDSLLRRRHSASNARSSSAHPCSTGTNSTLETRGR